MVKKDMKKPGSGWGTGRPATGRTHPVTIRLSDNAYNWLAQKWNKSAYIDYLITQDQSKELPPPKVNN